MQVRHLKIALFLSRLVCFLANLFTLSICLVGPFSIDKVNFRFASQKLLKTMNQWATNGWHCWREIQGSVRWLQPTTSQVIFKCGFILLCSCTLSQEALSMHTKQERTEFNQCAEWSQESRWRGVPTLFPLLFSVIFLSSPIWYSWLHSVSLCKLRSLTALTQERHTCKHVLQPVQNDHTLVNELVHVQSSPEAAKNDPCYSSDTTTGETRKATSPFYK